MKKMNKFANGNAVVVDNNSKVVFHIGQYEKKIIAHSTAKLIQVLPVYLLGLDKKYNLNCDELAIMSSSHLAQEQHVCVLESLLRKTNIREEDISIEPSAPSGHIAYDIWRENKSTKRKLYHACAGNHVGMMIAQRELTGMVKGYEQSNSYIQGIILKLMSEFCEYPMSRIEVTRDGCGIPTYILPMKCIAILYKNMIQISSLGEPVKRAVMNNMCAIWKNPVMLEGDGCLSTIISSHKGLVAKTGFGGLLAVGVVGLEFGVIIQSTTGCWSSVAFMADYMLKRIGYHSPKLSEELLAI